MQPLSTSSTAPMSGQPIRHPEGHPAIDALLTATATLLATDPERALGMASDALHLARDQHYRLGEAQANLLCGQSLHRLARLQEALPLLDEAARTFQEEKQAISEAQALIASAVVRRELGEHVQAHTALGQALSISTALGDLEVQAKVLNQQAALSLQTGQASLALEQLHAALSVRHQLGDRLGAAQCLNNIGLVHLRGNNLGLALSTLTESYELLRTVDDPTTTAQCLSNIARVHEELGDHQQCHDYTLWALELTRRQGNRTVEVYLLNNLAEAINNLKRYQEATTLFTEALGLAEEIGIRYVVGCAHHGLGRAALAQGRPNDALDHHYRALDIARELEERQNEIDALLGLGEAYVFLRQYDDARDYLQQALPLADSLALPNRAAPIRILLARTAQNTGHLHDALDHLWTARDLERELFDQDRDHRIQQLKVQFDVERAHHDAAVSQLQTELAKQAFKDAEQNVAKQTKRLAKAQVEVVTRLANAAEYRDDLTGKHTLRVGHVAALLAEHLGLDDETVSVLRVAARLHDVGKIGISDTILQKPSKLTSEEFETMKSHTVIGGQILNGGESPLLNMARDIAAAHHEHWDGSGYPNGLRGEEIPLTARIVSVADVYDALGHARPYKRAWTHEEVIAEITRQNGRQFQPEIVEALLALHDAGLLPLDNIQEDGEQLQRLLIQHSETAPPPSLIEISQIDVRNSPQYLELERRYREACRRIDQLQIQAFTDPLTGLANRRAFEDELETEILHAQRHGYPLSVVAIDLDGLKLVNDREGHERGDALLREITQAMRMHAGQAARLYRIGGDEFAIIVKDVQVSDQQAFMTHLAHAVATVQQRGFPAASVSAGIASYPEEATLESELLRLSDARMYAGKLERRKHPRDDANEHGTLRTSSERRRGDRRAQSTPPEDDRRAAAASEGHPEQSPAAESTPDATSAT